MSKDVYKFFWCRFCKSAEVLGASPAPRICPRSVPKTALTLETVHLGASPCAFLRALSKIEIQSLIPRRTRSLL